MTRKLIVEIVGDSSHLERTFRKASSDAARFETKISGVGKSLAKSTAGAAVAYFGTRGLISGLEKSVEAASNLNEEMSKNRAVFGRNSTAIARWAKTTSASLGISERQALATASGFGALFRPMGIVGAQAAEQSKQLTILGADLASFYNTDVQSALDAIRSGIVGESEPLRRYGVQLSEAKVQAEALQMTGKKLATELTVGEKTLARQAIILRETAVAHGDAAKTGDQFAGQMRRLTAQIEDLEAGLGGALLPHVTDLVDQFNEWLANPENKTAVIEGFTTAVDDLGAAFEFAAGAAGTMKGIFDWFSGHKGPSGRDILGKVGITGAATDFAGRLGIGGKGKTGGPGSTDVPFPPGWFDVQRPTGSGTSGSGSAGSRGGVPGQVGPAVSGALSTILGTADKWLAAGKRYDTATKAWQKARDRRNLMQERYDARQETRQGWLEFGLERAQATKRISDDLRWEHKLEKYWQDRIKVEGHKLELVRELYRTQQRIRDLHKTEATKDPLAGMMQVSTRQLAAQLGAGLGLGPTGIGRLRQNIAGAEIRPTYVTVELDGQVVGRAVTTAQTRASARTARQTSGFRG